MSPQPAPQRAHRPAWLTRAAWAALFVYGVTLAAIALWPTHVDEPASDLIRTVTRAISWLTYPRIEFAANIALFIPFGALLSILFPKGRWWLVIAAAVATSITAELLQMLAADRTSTVQDVVANTSGAALGVLIVYLAAKLAEKRQGRPIP
ncbi:MULTISPECIES: VanZ family protein [Bacteria]